MCLNVSVCRDVGIRSEGILKARAKGESRTEEREGEREKKRLINSFQQGIYSKTHLCVFLFLSVITCTSVVFVPGSINIDKRIKHN